MAVCQLERSGGDLEVGLTVLADFRRHGCGRALLLRSAVHARARGLNALIVHSLGDNTSMLLLARRIGMTVEIQRCEVEGRLTLESALDPAPGMDLPWAVAFERFAAPNSTTSGRDSAVLRSH